jgi:cytochrome P450
MNIDTRPDGRKVCPFDHHSVEYAQGYRETYKEMREAGSILWSDSYGGFWIATDYESIRKILRDSETFAMDILDDMKEGGPLIPTPEEFVRFASVPGLFFFTDGQRHDTPRAALSSHFSKRRVATMDDTIRSHVDRALDRVIPQGEFDIVHDLAMAVVAGVVSDKMGFDLEDPVSVFRAVTSPGELGADNEPVPAGKAEQAVLSPQDVFARIGEAVRARRASPRDDVISVLLQANGGQFTDAEVEGMCMQVILGAVENPQALTGHCMIFLADRHELRAQLHANPSQIPDFVLEALRYFNVSTGVARTARRDAELGGIQIRRGDRIFLPLPSANFDSTKYDHPDEFNIERRPDDHLALGAGSHTCLGASLSLTMVSAMVQGLLERVEAYTIDPDKVVRNTDKAANEHFVSAPMRIGSLRAPSAEHAAS